MCTIFVISFLTNITIEHYFQHKKKYRSSNVNAHTHAHAEDYVCMLTSTSKVLTPTSKVSNGGRCMCPRPSSRYGLRLHAHAHVEGLEWGQVHAPTLRTT